MAANSSVYIVQVYTTLVARARCDHTPGYRKLKPYRNGFDHTFRSLVAGDIRAARKHFGLTREIVRKAAMQRIERSEGYATRVNMSAETSKAGNQSLYSN